MKCEADQSDQYRSFASTRTSAGRKAPAHSNRKTLFVVLTLEQVMIYQFINVFFNKSNIQIFNILSSILNDKMNYDYKIIPSQFTINVIHPFLEIKRAEYIKNIINQLRRNNLPLQMIVDFIWSNQKFDLVIPYTDNYNTEAFGVFGINDADALLHKIRFKFICEQYFRKLVKISNNLNTNSKTVTYLNNLLMYEIDGQVNSIHITPYTYTKMKTRLEKNLTNIDFIHMLMFCVMYRYKYISGDNQQLAISNDVKDKIKSILDINFELFASAINCYSDNFSSLFPDIEHYFGSKGSFFSFTPIEGFYLANPPYYTNIIEAMAKHLLKALDNTILPLGFIITVPIWDYPTLDELQTKCHIDKKYVQKSKEYGEYVGLNLLIESKYCHKKIKVCSNKFVYTDHLTGKLARNVANTYVIIIHNDKLHIDDEQNKKLDELFTKN